MTVVFVVLAVVLTVPVYAFAVRRLLGLRLSPLRAWIGGLIALVCASPIITAIGSSIAKHKGSWSLLPAAWSPVDRSRTISTRQQLTSPICSWALPT